MDLSGILPTKEVKKKHYWAIIIEPSTVSSGIWNITEEKVELVAQSSPIVWNDDSDLISSVDAALSSSIQNFPQSQDEPEEVVFGVPNQWVKEGNIVEDLTEKIKKICSELSLKPTGFVVLSEAIAHFLKSEEGSPVTAVVIGLFKEEIEVSLFSIGKIQGSTSVIRSVSVSDDVAEGLSRISVGESFPSRFILYDGKEGELEDARQMLIDAKWEDFEKIKFLHTPKIEIISPDKKIQAVSLAGGMELGNASKVVKNMALSRDEELDEEFPQNNEIPESGTIKIDQLESDVERTKDITPQDVGFVLGEDVSEVKEGSDEELPGRMGIGNQSTDFSQETQMPPNANQNAQTNKPVGTSSLFKSLSGLTGKLSGVKKPKFSIGNRLTQTRNIFLIASVFVIFLAVGIFAWWWFYPKATVTIFVSPQKLEDSTLITIDKNAPGISVDDKVIPGEMVSETVEADKSKSTSGTKTVGDRAKGEVTIYRAGSQITLDAGTEITSSSGLEFTLDEDTSVASGSASTPGTTNVKVTASSIGEDYNISGNQSFSVSNYPSSELEAKNTDGFSGGSSREVSVVSEDDMDQLEKELTDQIVDDAMEKIESGLQSGVSLIKESAQTEVVKKSFDKKEGEEAGTVTLTMELTVSILAIKNEDLNSLSMEILKSKVVEGYALKADQIKYQFDYQGEDDGKYSLDTKFIVNLLPSVDTDEIKKSITGKYAQVASDYLVNIKGFKRAEIKIDPKLPGKLNTLPRVVKNISIEIQAL